MPWKHAKPVIGLTGGVGSGKTFVARQFARYGCAVIDSDQIAREQLDDPQVRQALRQRWGEKVMRDGEVDRAAVAGIVFEDPAELRFLEDLIHPRVRAQRRLLRERFLADPRAVAIVEDCPLLLEKRLDEECDVVIFVQASRATRLNRLAVRGWTAKDLDAREKNQIQLDLKAQRADYVLDNNADEVQCVGQVRGVLSQILQALP